MSPDLLLACTEWQVSCNVLWVTMIAGPLTIHLWPKQMAQSELSSSRKLSGLLQFKFCVAISEMHKTHKFFKISTIYQLYLHQFLGCFFFRKFQRNLPYIAAGSVIVIVERTTWFHTRSNPGASLTLCERPALVKSDCTTQMAGNAMRAVQRGCERVYLLADMT